jgi:hypothetical protein
MKNILTILLILIVFVGHSQNVHVPPEKSPLFLQHDSLYIDSAKLFSFGWISPVFFGVKGDGKVVYDGVTTASSTTFTSATANFSSTDVGKSIRIQGAGTSNVDFITNIASVTNSTTVVLAASTPSAVSATTFDYGTDNTSLIQSMMNYIAHIGGGRAQFKRGLYLLFGALQTSVNGVNPNCQIYVPLTNVNVGDSTYRQIQLEGEYDPQLLSPQETGADVNAVQNCTVFKSEIIGTGTTPSIIGSPYYTPSFIANNYNYTSLELDGILFQTVSSVNNTAVAGTMSCVNVAVLGQARIRNCGAFTETPIYSGAVPVNKTYGFIMPQFLNNGVSQLDFTFAWNYNTGYLVAEHLLGSQVTALCDSFGIEQYSNVVCAGCQAHGATIEALQIEDCVIPVLSVGAGTLYIESFRGERHAGGVWYGAGSYDVQFNSLTDSGAVFINQYDMGLSGGTSISYDINTNAPYRLRVKYNFTKDIDNSQINYPYASSLTFDLYKTKKFFINLTGNTTVNFVNLSPGDRFQVELVQDYVGGRTVTFGSNSVFKTGQSLSVSPYLTDICTGYYDGTAILWNIDGGYLNNYAGGPPQVYIAALTANGYSPGNTEIAGYNIFYDSLVSQGLLPLMKAIYLFSGSTANTHMLNFLNPVNTDAGYRILWNGTITHTYGTITGDGSTGYADTRFDPSVNLNFPTGGVTSWFTSNSLPTSLGGYSTVGSTSPSLQVTGLYDGSDSYYTNGDGAGNLVDAAYPTYRVDSCITDVRTSSSLMTVYRNGSSIGTASGTIVPANYPAGNILLLCRNSSGTHANFTTNPMIFCLFHNSNGWTSTQATQLYNDLATLKTAMGK